MRRVVRVVRDVALVRELLQVRLQRVLRVTR